MAVISSIDYQKSEAHTVTDPRNEIESVFIVHRQSDPWQLLYPKPFFFLDSTIQMSLITLQTRAAKMHAVGFEQKT